MIRFRCAACETELEVERSLVGRVVACGECGRRARVPAPRRSNAPLLVGAAVALLSAAAGGAFFLVGRPQADSPPAPAVVAEPKVVAPPPDDAMPRLVQLLVDQLNAQRRLEGVPVVALDEGRSRGCREHAEHLIRHAADPLLDPHDQADGAAVSVAPTEPRKALQAWLAAPAHRAFLLDKDLASFAVGWARSADGKWVSVFDFTRGRAAWSPAAGDPVLYPAPNQADVPLLFPGNEIPDPLPDAADKLGGFPVTVSFPRSTPIGGASATLEDEYGVEVPAWLSSPARPANPKFARNQGNTVCLIARRPLRPGTRYVVRAECGEWAKAWTFTTQPPAEYGRRVYERALAQLNEYRAASGLREVALDKELSRRCGLHAHYLAIHLDRAEGVGPNDEKPGLAGFTQEGQEIAPRSLVRMGGGTGPRDAFEWVMASVLNRHLALNPSLRAVGMAAEPHSPRGWLWVIHAPAERRDGDGPRAVLYPGKGQKDVPLYLGRPASTLTKDAPLGAVAGYAVSANFFPRRRVAGVTAKLAEASGAAVPCWLSTPEKPLAGAGSYRQILLVPKSPLRPATTYSVQMSANVAGSPWSEGWAFTTLDRVAYRAGTAAELVKRVNAARAQARLTPVTLDDSLSKGCQAHAEYVAANLEHPKVQGLGIHEEDASLPGATKAGAAAGTASVIAILPDPLDSVGGWLATLYHRLPLLDARLRRVGYGQAQHPTRGWVTVLDSGSGRAR